MRYSFSRDNSPQGRKALAERLWELVRTDPGALAEGMHTNSLVVEILRAGLNLYIQQVQSEERGEENSGDEVPAIGKKNEKQSRNRIIVVLDSNDGHITKVFTSDSCLDVRVVDIDTDLKEPVEGPYYPGVTVVVADVDAAATEHIKTQVPDYEPEEAV
ncbi:MAG: hypothetical protein H0V70_25840 [Ktedonobacteraceae bacterium]|nr:hypothetical protein [Ktedonobacteraceae bacterium]